MTSAGRPRSTEASARILAATVALLAERGAAGVSVEAVAARAGVTRPTVYRRWRNRTELIAAAVRDRFAEANPEAPHTGDPAHDLVTVLTATVRLLTGGPLGRVIGELVPELPRSPELAEALHAVERDRRRVLYAVLDRLHAAGRLRTPDADTAVDALLGPVYFRLLLTGDAVGEPLVRDLVALVVREDAGRPVDAG